MAGIIIVLTPFATFLPLNISAAIFISENLPFVQEPITTWSIFTSPASSTVFVFSGKWGNDTVGVLKSMVYSSSYTASASASYTVYGFVECSFV